MLHTVNLRSVTTASNAHADVYVGESGRTQQQDGLQDLHSDGLRLNELNGDTIDLDQALSGLAVRYSHRITLHRVVQIDKISETIAAYTGALIVTAQARTLRPNT